MVTVWWKPIRKKRRWMNRGDRKAEFVVVDKALKAIFYPTPSLKASLYSSGLILSKGNIFSVFMVRHTIKLYKLYRLSTGQTWNINSQSYNSCILAQQQE